MWEEPLSERADSAVALLQRLPDNKRVLVLSDADVDGVAAAAALITAFQRTGRRFVARLSRRRDRGFWDDVLSDPPSFLITADMGASEVTRFEAAHVPTIVLDHHVPARAGDDEGPVVHVNPHLVGEDGSATASGAAVAATFGMAWLEAHGRRGDDLLAYALLGARGDRYHAGGVPGGLHGRIAEAIAATEPAPARRVAGPALEPGRLADALADSVDPYVARAAGKPGAAAALLRDAKLDPDADAGALDDDARRRFTSWLTLELLEQGADAALVRDAVSPHWVYGDGAPMRVRGLPVDAVVARIDAAARLNEATKSLAGLLGHAQSWDALEAALGSWRETVRAPLAAAARGRMQPLGPGHLGRVERGRYAGVIADRIMAWTKLGGAPVVVVGPMDDETLKVSLRARHDGTPWQLDRVAADAAKKAGGTGGGHHLAAGATVPRASEDAFLTAVAEGLRHVAVKRQEATH